MEQTWEIIGLIINSIIPSIITFLGLWYKLKSENTKCQSQINHLKTDVDQLKHEKKDMLNFLQDIENRIFEIFKDIDTFKDIHFKRLGEMNNSVRSKYFCNPFPFCSDTPIYKQSYF